MFIVPTTSKNVYFLINTKLPIKFGVVKVGIKNTGKENYYAIYYVVKKRNPANVMFAGFFKIKVGLQGLEP